MNAADVGVTNTDNDTASITVIPTSGLTTTEGGGTATLAVVITSQPAANVTMGLSSSDLTEGTVAPASVTFTSANWNTAQTVTVTGVDDFRSEEPTSELKSLAYVACSVLLYKKMNASDVGVTNTDDDTAGITVIPTSGLTTTEGGFFFNDTATTEIYTLSLHDALPISSDLTEGTVAPASVMFTPANWNTAQTVTVTGVDDFAVDGNVAYTIVTAAATSTDAGYNGMNPADVAVTNMDNDTAGISVIPTSGLTTTESGGTATITVLLPRPPPATVTTGFRSSDLTEGTVAPASLTFTPANWNTTQTVTVTGVNDFAVDGNVAYTILTAAATSTDGSYNGLNAADVSVTNLDDDTSFGVDLRLTADRD